MNGDESTKRHTGATERDASAGKAALDLEAVRARVLSDIARERGVLATLRNLSTRARLALAMVAIAFVFAAFFAAIPWVLANYPYIPPQWQHLGWGRSWEWGGRTLALAAAGALLLIALVRRALRPLHVVAARTNDAWLLALAFVVPFAMPLAVPHRDPEPTQQYSHCFVMGIVLGALLLLLLRALDRSVHADRNKALLAVGVAGFATALALQLACPWTGTLHRLSCHGPIGLALAAAYAIFARFTRR